MRPDITGVQLFWENNPLFAGESKWIPGSDNYFKEHRDVIIQDFFAGAIPFYYYPPMTHRKAVLDLGCGPGFWTDEFIITDSTDDITSCDLTHQALVLTEKRIKNKSVAPKFVQGNAENLPFKENSYSFINCQGVIHHTPNPSNCLTEMFRILKPGGRASVSVYYFNFFLRHWKYFKFLGILFSRFGLKITGRGRESLFRIEDPDELIRSYDGEKNPIGYGYVRRDFIHMVEKPGFIVKRVYYIGAPSRIIPVQFPRFIRTLYQFMIPYMVGVIIEKPRSE